MNAARERLRAAAAQIAANRGEQSVGPFVALRKLFVEERRDWKQPGAPRVGWKRGELFEVLEALLKCDFNDALKELGDCGYYIAQSFGALWALYALITPKSVMAAAAEKFERRAWPNGRAFYARDAETGEWEQI